MVAFIGSNTLKIYGDFEILSEVGQVGLYFLASATTVQISKSNFKNFSCPSQNQTQKSILQLLQLYDFSQVD